jgi:hypothetical protein
MTNKLIFVWFVIVGIVAVLRPTFFFKREKLTPEKVERNTKIWRWCGAGILVCGLAGFAIEILTS